MLLRFFVDIIDSTYTDNQLFINTHIDFGNFVAIQKIIILRDFKIFIINVSFYEDKGIILLVCNYNKTVIQSFIFIIIHIHTPSIIDNNYIVLLISLYQT